MADISVAQSGLWSDTATWVGGVLPDSTDSISLLAAYTLTVDGAYTISGGTVAQDGKIVVDENCKLTNITNQLIFGTTTAPRKSYLELRAGAELELNANMQLYACGVTTIGTTKASPAVISGSANITTSANSGRGFFNCEHIAFLLAGTVDVRWGAAGLSFTDANSYVFNNCVFNGPSYVFGSLTQAVSNFVFNASDFRDAACTFYFLSNTGLSEIKGSTFSASTLKTLTLYAGGSTVDFSGTVFDEYNVVTRTKNTLNLNFVSTFAALRDAPAATTLLVVEDDSTSGNGTYEDSYYYMEIENLRALTLGSNATSANADATHHVGRNVFEIAAASAGNPIVVGPTRIEAYENVQIGYIQPWLSRAYAVGAAPNGLSVVRNTQYGQSGDDSPALVSFEQAVVAYPGEVTAHSNLAVWETTPHSDIFAALACERSSTVDDGMKLVGHNATFGAGSGARYAYASATTDLTANDVILPSAPTFVDSTRNLAAWGAARGADGTVQGAIDLLLAINGYDAATKTQNGTASGVTVPDLVSWVRAGYVPTTAELAGTGYLGVDIGAMDVGSADDTAPVLTSPTANATGPTTATASVSTDDGNGTLYFLASTNATESASTVKAALSQSVTTAGEQSISLSALNPETTYYVHFVQINGASLESASVVTTNSITTQAIVYPEISATIAASSTSAVSATVTTDTAGGTIYGVLSTSSTEMEAADIKSGADDSAEVTDAGDYTLDETGLATWTQYYWHIVHEDADGLMSNVLTLPVKTLDISIPLVFSGTSPATLLSVQVWSKVPTKAEVEGLY